jgi:2-iminoacetate synthase
VDDANFKKLVAIIRIAVPYTGMILSTRESAEMRDELLKVGGIDELQFGVANW